MTDTNTTQPVNKEHEGNTHRGHMTRFTAAIASAFPRVATFVFPPEVRHAEYCVKILSLDSCQSPLEAERKTMLPVERSPSVLCFVSLLSTKNAVLATIGPTAGAPHSFCVFESIASTDYFLILSQTTGG